MILYYTILITIFSVTAFFDIYHNKTGFADALFRASLPAALVFSLSFIVVKVLNAPFFLWNGARLAWALSPLYGHALYPPFPGGLLLSGMYPPLAAIIYFPSFFIKHPANTVIFSSILTAFYYFIPAFFVLSSRISGGESASGKISGLSGFICFCLFSFYSPPLTYSAFTVSPDAAALSFSAIAAALLITQTNGIPCNSRLVISGFFAVVAVYTKLFSLTLLFVLPIYVLIRMGRSKFKVYISSLGFFLFFFTGIFSRSLMQEECSPACS